MGRALPPLAAELMRRCWLALLLACVPLMAGADSSASTNSKAWQQQVAAAQGKTVYFYAWGGSQGVNNYLRWAGRELRQQYGIRLEHVKVDDIATAVTVVMSQAEGAGAVDLMWINGENFRTLKQAGLLRGKLDVTIPNVSELAFDKLPLNSDFGEPVEGFEVPWGIGQFHLLARADSFSGEQLSPAQLVQFAQENPNRFTYPAPPEFHGTTFLKSLLVALSEQDSRLYEPVTEAAATELLPLLWGYLDKLHPLLWRQGEVFAQSVSEQQRLLADGVLDIAFSFNPNELEVAAQAGRLPANLKRATLGAEAITNSHYLAIPVSAQAPAAAEVVIQFLVSRAAQQQKAQLSGWGDPSVRRDMLQQQQLFPATAELHSSWQDYLERAWLERYQH
ncbi:MAG: ABC transporter substrate-binding protein [Idiomarina sp.]